MGWLLMMLLEQDVALMKLPHLSVLSVDLAIYTPASVWRRSLPKWPKMGRTCWSSMHCAPASRTPTHSTNQSEKIPCCGQTKTTMWDPAFAEDISPDERWEIDNTWWKNNQLTICLPANPLPPSCHRNSPRWIVVHGAALHSSNRPWQ